MTWEGQSPSQVTEASRSRFYEQSMYPLLFMAAYGKLEPPTSMLSLLDVFTSLELYLQISLKMFSSILRSAYLRDSETV